MGDAALPEPQDSGPVAFPQEWTVFARSFEATFGYTLEMGVQRDRPLFAVRIHSNFGLFGRPALVLHRGPTKDGARLGLVRDATLNPMRRLDFDVVVPPAGCGVLDGEDDKNMEVEVRAAILEVFPVHKFSVPVGQGRTESFEWRHTFGPEVGDLVGGGPAAGWKLVRIDPQSGAVGFRTSGDREMVAVWVSGRKNLKEALKFRFLNSGASGELGHSFRYAAVMSALGMWDHLRRERQKNPDHGGG